MYNCKSCEISFRTISLLRKHQWAKHRETFDNLRKAAQSLKTRKKLKETWARKLSHNGASNSSNNSNNSITSLLNKLSDQRDLLNNAIDLIKGVTEHDE